MTKECDTRTKIFNVAARLFSERGFPRVSMREIAHEVGIQAASIYHHFETKEQILDEILGYYREVMIQFYNDTMRKTSMPNYEPKLDDILPRYAEEKRELMQRITRIIYMEQFTCKLAEDLLLSREHEKYTVGEQLFFEVLAERGIIKNPDNCPLYADLFSRISQTYQMDFVHPEYTPLVQDLSDMSRILLKLILHNEGSEDSYDRLVK